MKAVVVDDELKSRLVLQNLLENFCEGVDVIGSCEDIDSAVKSIKSLKPDVVFLDINLKEGDSFQILQQLDEILFEIVFVTAYDEDSVKALKYSGIDCLLKPIDIDELQNAVNKLSLRSMNIQMAYQMADGMLKSKFTKIPVITASGLVFTETCEIIYLEQCTAGVRIHMSDGMVMTSSRNVKEFADILSPDEFYKVSQKYVVNLSQVNIKASTSGFIHFKNKEQIPVTSDQLNHLKALL
jgi:two-component system LytT family response regulator